MEPIDRERTLSTISTWQSAVLAFLLLIFCASLSAWSAQPATGPEDVPDLTQPPAGGGEKKQQTNRPPEILSLNVTPSRVVAGVHTIRMPSGVPVSVRIDVVANDPDGDDLVYIYSDNLLPDDTETRTSIGYTVPSPTIIALTVTVRDPFGAEDRKTVVIPVFDQNDDDVNLEVQRRTEILRQLSPQGRAQDEFSNPNGVTRTIEGSLSGTAGDAGTAEILTHQSPWRYTEVQNCVRQYLQQVVLPVESRLAPGQFSQIDDWGRLLGPKIRATGSVDGNWDNPTHFVWNEFNDARTTERYGIALKNFVQDCLKGQHSRTSPSPGSPAATQGDTDRRSSAEQSFDLYTSAQARITAGNASTADPERALSEYQQASELLRRAQLSDSGRVHADVINQAITLVDRNIDSLQKSVRQSASIVERITAGEPFTVSFDGSCPPDEGYQGESDPLGTLQCGKSYDVVYNRQTVEWTVTGLNEHAGTVGTWIYRNADPRSRQISLWGRVFTFDDKGSVIDSQFGRVGSLSFARSAGGQEVPPSPEQKKASDAVCAVFVTAERVGAMGQRTDFNSDPNALRHTYVFASRGGWQGDVIIRWTKPPARICSGQSFTYTVEVENLIVDSTQDAGFPVADISFAPVGAANLQTTCSNPSPYSPVSRVTVRRSEPGRSNTCTSVINVVGGAANEQGGILFTADLNSGPSEAGATGFVHYIYRRE